MSYMSSPKHLPALYPVYIFSWNSPYYFHRSYFYSLTYITFIITSNILLHRLMSARPMFSKMSCHAKFTKHFLKIFYVSGFIVIDISISTNIPYLLSSSHNLMQNMDKSADPCVDFYTYACGNWPKIHPLPDDAVYYDTFAVLKQDIRLKIKNLLEQPIDASDSEAIITVKNFFFSCMNECKFSFNHDILISQGSMRLIDTVALGLYKKPKKLKKTAINGGKKKTKPSKKKTKPAESSKDEGYYCLFCLEPYSNSRPRETWIKFKGSLCSAVDIVGIDDDESKCISILALIDERKEQPLLDLLNKLGGWPVISQKWSEKDFNLVILMAKLRLFNNDILISEGIGPDKRNSSINVIQIDQSRLGMPVPDYFLSKGRHYKAYLQYMVETAMLLGTPKKKAEFEMTEVAEFETQLANITVKDEFRRDINKIYRKISIRQLRKEVPELFPKILGFNIGVACKKEKTNSFIVFYRIWAYRQIPSEPVGLHIDDHRINFLAYADDVDIMGHSVDEINSITQNFRMAASRIGLNVNQQKTKIMEVSRDPSLEESQVIDGMPIQVTTSFKYLGSVVTSDGRITEELNCRLGAANRCLRSLDDIMRKKRVSKTTKMRIYKTVIRPILTYGCETWPMTSDTERNFRTFENRILRRITGPVFDEGLQKWRIKYNQELYDELQHTAITNWIKSRQVLWAGHVARMGDDRLPKKICQGEVPGRRPRGRPRKSWEKSLKETIRPHIDRNAGDWWDLAQDRAKWRALSRATMGLQGLSIDWLTYFKILIPNLVGDQEEVVTFAMTYFKKFGKLVAKTKPRVLANYLMWRFVFNRNFNLDKRFQEIQMKYYKVLYGSLNPPARWMKCTSYVNQNLGMAVGASFVKKYFSDESKEMALEMISEISESFTELLKNASWMDKGAKSLAMEKVEKITRNIGFPNFILNNTALDNYYSDVSNFQSYIFYVNNRWMTSPADVNAYYTRTQNMISFPAGILQPPLYSQFYSRVLNYGGIGVVIGHEITHGFDDKGRQFDEEGNLNEWWQNDVVEKFENQTFCFIDQYDNYVVNGLRTVGENIADNGGVKQSFLAYKKWVQKNGDEQLLPGLGLTNYQLFFLNYAQVWCGSGRTEAMVYRLKTGVHTPGQFRLGHP
ncbi:Neprilysin-4 [Nymphon striatum]|nr:Neprilysin-4 [Nymphon striatum]